MQTDKDFIEKIPQKTRIAFFGAGVVAAHLFNYIKENRPDINMVCCIDSFAQGEMNGLKIYNLTEIEAVKDSFDILVFTTRKSIHELSEIFTCMDIKYLIISREEERYCRRKDYVPKFEKACDVLKTNDDKKLYKILCEFLLGSDDEKIRQYVLDRHGIKLFGPVRNYHKQYMEFINKDSIKTIFDAGVCNGVQFFVYKKLFKNLKKIYGFDPMYDKFKKETYDFFIQKMPEVEIIDKGLWNKEEELSFVETPNNQAGSYVQEAKNSRPLNEIDNIYTIKTTTIDRFKQSNSIEKIDFIKMDIEGSELNALKGGEKTILSDRPQMAISIYHSIDDFADIPVYLSELLKGQNYTFHLGHYSAKVHETVLYAIPDELTEQKLSEKNS